MNEHERKKLDIIEKALNGLRAKFKGYTQLPESFMLDQDEVVAVNHLIKIE